MPVNVIVTVTAVLQAVKMWKATSKSKAGVSGKSLVFNANDYETNSIIIIGQQFIRGLESTYISIFFLKESETLLRKEILVLNDNLTCFTGLKAEGKNFLNLVIYSDVIIAVLPKYVNKNFTNPTWKQLENIIIAILSNLNPHSVATSETDPRDFQTLCSSASDRPSC